MTSRPFRVRPPSRPAGRHPGFVPLLLLSFTASAAMILGLAWKPGLNRAMGAPEASVFPGFTAEGGGGGLVVTSLRSGSEAARDGLSVGDAVVAIDGRAIDTLDQARRYLHSDARPALLLDIDHGHQRRQIRLARGQDGAQAAAGGG
jgi:membrane-associated protease RseP (regulator of RpoE activity)